MDLQAAEILHFQIKRDIVSLYKRFLNTLEDVRADHDTMIKKLERAIPSEYDNVIANCNYFDNDKFNHLRKRVLDSGNESIRGIEEELKQFEIGFGKQQG